VRKAAIHKKGEKRMNRIIVMIIKRLLLSCALAACLGLTTELRAEATYPQQSITLVVGGLPGNSVSVTALLFANELKEKLGQPVIVEHIPGGGTTLGAAKVARAKPDGYTILLTGSGATQAQVVRPNVVPYRVLRDFEPIAAISGIPILIWARSDLGFKDAADMINYARAHPNALSYAHNGVGGTFHLGMEMLLQSTGIKMRGVPFNSSSVQQMQALFTGDVDVLVSGSTIHEQIVSSGKGIALGYLSSQKMDNYGEIKTLVEQGYKDVSLNTILGFLAPVGTPGPVVDRLEKAILSVASDPSIQSKLRDLGMTMDLKNRRAYRDQLEQEVTKVTKIVEVSKLKIE
jgi:tripartite-type tricarboxylate transporter receptor subunit TctC